MNLYIDTSEIQYLHFTDGFICDTLTIMFKDGSKRTIRKYADVGWELAREYKRLLEQIKKNKTLK